MDYSDDEDQLVLDGKQSMSSMNMDRLSLSASHGAFNSSNDSSDVEGEPYDHAHMAETKPCVSAERHFPHVDLNHSIKMTEAIQAQNYDALVKILKGIGLTPVTYRGPNGNLLHVVVAFGPPSFIPKLLADGIDLNEPNADGDTALHIAARIGRAAVIDQLLAVEGLDDSITNNLGQTPYQVAKNRQISTAIEYARSLYINKKTRELHALVAKGDTAGLQELFSSHHNQAVLNVNAPDSHGDTILHIAAKMEHSPELIKLCLDLGADPYLKNKKGKLPIEVAKDDVIKNTLKDAPMIKADSILSSKTRMEGYLNKWTNYAEGYKKRWFVLEDGVLSYYKSQMEYPVSCRGSMNLQFATVHRHHADKLRFEVISTTNASTKIHIRAGDVAEAQRWIIALNQASISSMSSTEVDKAGASTEPLTLALSTTDDFRSLLTKALTNLGELEILLNEFLQPEDGFDRPKLTVENTVNYLFLIREVLLAAEEHELQWRRKWELERRQKQLLEESFQKLAVETARMERYSRIKSIGEASGKRATVVPSYEEATDEFFDALEAEEGEAEEAPSVMEEIAAPSVDVGFVAEDAVGYPEPRRTFLPSDSTGMPPVSLWGILKNAIGKDLTRIPIPVNYSEPVSMLQRLCEEMEYSELLDSAWSSADPLIRIQYVAAFAASSYASTDGRTTKPFNPLLGETFEYVSLDRGFRYVSEQVSHHPPISACHCESSRYIMWAEVNVSSKFWGKSMELVPEGHSHLILKGVGPDGSDEHYSWRKVKTAVNNIVVGKLWIDHYGEMQVQCHQNNVQCILDFKATGWRTVEPKRIVGKVVDAAGNQTHELNGFWHSRITTTNLETEQTIELWRKRPLPPQANAMYKFTTFTMTLNELDEDLRTRVAPTDSRLRPDQRAMEQGDFDGANKLKVQLEERQRATRKMLEAQGLCLPGPRWFKLVEEPNTGSKHWEFNGQYWALRRQGNWESVPSIFLCHADTASD